MVGSGGKCSQGKRTLGLTNLGVLLYLEIRKNVCKGKRMLVRITESCMMGCSHCMIDATPEGGHMREETFRTALEFISGVEGGIVMISGGEPIDHPEFFKFVEIAKQERFMVLVMSNGMFLENEELRERVLALNVQLQITNDERFYPKRIFEYKHKNISWESELRMLSPFGRAIKNGIHTSRQSPLCFNLRSVLRSTRSLPDAIRFLRMKGKFCTPSINIDGSISAGESNSCYRVGFVGEPIAKIANGIMSMKCNYCGLEDGLEDKYREAIGLETIKKLA